LGGLKWMEGTVPMSDGNIKIYCSTSQIKIKGDNGTGTLRIKSKSKPICKNAAITLKGNNVYELTLSKSVDYVINYSSL